MACKCLPCEGPRVAGNGRVENFQTCLHIRARRPSMLAEFQSSYSNCTKSGWGSQHRFTCPFLANYVLKNRWTPLRAHGDEREVNLLASLYRRAQAGRAREARGALRPAVLELAAACSGRQGCCEWPAVAPAAGATLPCGAAAVDRPSRCCLAHRGTAAPLLGLPRRRMRRRSSGRPRGPGRGGWRAS